MPRSTTRLESTTYQRFSCRCPVGRVKSELALGTSFIANCCNPEDETESEKVTRRRYTLEDKREAVRLVTSSQKVSGTAKAPGIVEQTLANWVKADRSGHLCGLSGSSSIQLRQ